MPIKPLLMIAAASLLLLGLGVHAQQVPNPGAIQRGAEDVRKFYRLERQLAEPDTTTEDLVDAPKAPISSVPEDMAQQKIFVNRIETDPSDVLDPEAIRIALQGLEGQQVAIAELFAALERINALYAEQRCVTCRAFLPAQDVVDGVVRIQLVEARVGELRITGNRYTRASFFSNRVQTEQGELFDIASLERELIRLNTLNAVRARSRLEPGASFGTVDVVLEAIEPSRWQGVVFADNSGRDTVGEYRLGATIINNGVFGRSDPLTLTLTGAEGTEGIFASYNTPLNSLGTRLTLLYDRSAIEIQEGPFEVLDISGNASTTGMSVSHPLRVTGSSRLQAFVGGFIKESETDFGSVTLFSTRLRTAVVGVDYLWVGEHGVVFTSHTVTHGDDDAPGSEPFFKYNADLSWQRPFGDDYSTILRVTGQWSDDGMIASQEQFQLGGTASVRGYEEALLAGDDGYFISGEVQAPVNLPQKSVLKNMQARALAFLDHGAAFPEREGGKSSTSDDFLTSIGVGFNLKYHDRFTARATLGFPLSDPFDNQSTMRAHIYLEAAF